MLEHQMELAVANCPDLFIEAGLTLIRRQMVINNRRPDIVFSDKLSRHLLVEIQRGRLDEQHLQRHFYYYYDYRAKYPKTHPRLMFIANRIVPQHKEFLDDHGYEFREVPDNDFLHRWQDCAARHPDMYRLPVEILQTPGVLPPRFHGIVYEIEKQEMTLCYKMLLLIEMVDFSDERGGVALRLLAERFKHFFAQRSSAGRMEENPKRFRHSLPSQRSIADWQRIIRNNPLRYLTKGFLIDEGNRIRWAPRIWAQWNPLFKEQLRAAARDRLVRYFNRHVPGGF